MRSNPRTTPFFQTTATWDSTAVSAHRTSTRRKGLKKTNRACREVGAKVRQTIKELGGMMPENLPATGSIKKLETKATKALKGKKP